MSCFSAVILTVKHHFERVTSLNLKDHVTQTHFYSLNDVVAEAATARLPLLTDSAWRELSRSYSVTQIWEVYHWKKCQLTSMPSTPGTPAVPGGPGGPLGPTGPLCRTNTKIVFYWNSSQNIIQSFCCCCCCCCDSSSHRVSLFAWWGERSWN